MIPATEAEQIILNLVQPLADDRETVSLLDARDRILADTITSQLDFPHWDNSAMDGYAVRHADVQTASTAQPVELIVIEDIPAGKPPQHAIQPGQAARILTGSMLPPGADTVVMQEETERAGDLVRILTAPQAQDFVRHRASFYQAGQPLLSAGLRLTAPAIAVLAAAQCTQIPVYRRPRVAILSTGSELVTPDQPLQPGQIVDSNQYALMTLAQQAGAEVLALGIVSDDPTALKTAIAQAVHQADVVLSSGGVSVGDYDYVDRILTELGGELAIRAVAVKPGKPLTVATVPVPDRDRPTLYFGLPGNPVSALVSFWRFVQPALKKLSGQSAPWSPAIVTGITQQDLKSGGRRETYLWGQVESHNGQATFTLAGGGHSSGNLINLASTNGLAIVPVGTRLIPAQNPVQILLI